MLDWRRALVIGVEIQSTGLRLTTEGRNTAVLFGDGAGAAVLERKIESDSRGILSLTLGSDGAYAEKLGITCPSFARAIPICPSDFEGEDAGAFPHMDGKLVFKAASQKMPALIRELCGDAEVTLDQLKLIIPHQANQRILDMLAHDLALSPDKVFSNVSRYGNTTAASIPIALSEASEQGKINRGDLIALVAFGSGFSWGAALLRW